MNPSFSASLTDKVTWFEFDLTYIYTPSWLKMFLFYVETPQTSKNLLYSVDISNALFITSH